jgi:hypothetical protein
VTLEQPTPKSESTPRSVISAQVASCLEGQTCPLEGMAALDALRFNGLNLETGRESFSFGSICTPQLQPHAFVMLSSNVESSVSHACRIVKTRFSQAVGGLAFQADIFEF